MAAKAYIRAGEWSEVTVSTSRKGWLIRRNIRIIGETTGSRVFIPFGGDFPRGCDLNRPWNVELDSYGYGATRPDPRVADTYGTALCDRAEDCRRSEHARAYYHARILSRGYEVR